MGKATKVIDVDQTGDNFILLEDALLEIFSKVPEDMPVSIVGVVGAFRTGKSFLLDFFLRYLKNTDGTKLDLDLDVEDKKLEWMSEGGNLEGGESNEHEGFKWSPGETRCTTGIWIWDEPFIRIDRLTNKPMAVFLMDTQGMHDHETGQHLTASIFGLGSLLSSYMVFNLSKQIQEDHIQQLALFSEYGRVATDETSGTEKTMKLKAFQKMDFLVRDYPHFQKGVNKNKLGIIRMEMQNYLDKAMAQRFQEDLKEVRDQIKLCYDEIGCYCLPHPGNDVAEVASDFEGEIDVIRPLFRRLLGDYIRIVFNDRACIKKIQGEEVTAMKLFEYFKVYCRLFEESDAFPKAKTLLKETQETSIRFATNKSLELYNKHMIAAGLNSYFLEKQALNQAHESAVKSALFCFGANNKSGTGKMREEAKESLIQDFEELFKDFKIKNALKEAEEKESIDLVIRDSLNIYSQRMTDAGLGSEYLEKEIFSKVDADARTASLGNLEKNTKPKRNLKKTKIVFLKKIEERSKGFKTRNRLRGKEEIDSIDSAIREAHQIYNQEMDSSGIGDCEMTDAEVLTHHKEAVGEAVAFYRAKEKLGNEAKMRDGERRLEKRMKNAVTKYQKFNDLKLKDSVIDLFVACREAVDLYFNLMDATAGPGSAIKSDTELQEAHNEALEESLDCFNKITGNKDDDQHIEGRRYLVNTLLKRLRNYKAINELRKQGVASDERVERLLARPVSVRRSNPGFWSRVFNLLN